MAQGQTAGAQAIQTTAAPKGRLTLRDYVMGDAVRGRLKDVASKYLQPDEIMRCVLVAASRTPRIAECTQDSIMRCMMEAAVIGVRPGGFMGRGWLVPRWNSKVNNGRGQKPGAYELSFDPGWRGLADVARRSKVVARIEAHVVYQRDTFRVTKGTNPTVIHDPYDGDDDPGEVRAAYAVAFFADNTTQAEVVRRRDLDKIMAASSSKDPKTGKPVGPWVDWYEEMARKSAVRRLCKYLPTDEELEYALEVATRAEMTPEGAVPELADPDHLPRAKKLADRIRAGAPEEEGEPPPPPPEEGEPTEETGDPEPREREPGEEG